MGAVNGCRFQTLTDNRFCRVSIWVLVGFQKLGIDYILGLSAISSQFCFPQLSHRRGTELGRGELTADYGFERRPDHFFYIGA